MQAPSVRATTAAMPLRQSLVDNATVRRNVSTSPEKGAVLTPLERAYLGSDAHAMTTTAADAGRSTKAISAETFQPHEELQVLRAIVAREQALDDLLTCCSTFEATDDNEEADTSVALLETLVRVRICSLGVIAAVASWRRRMVQVLPFHWRSVNYLLKMTRDLDFASRSRLALAALDGARLAKRNPFSTIGGLDASMRACWASELPDAADLPVLLDATATTVEVDVATKIRLAEHMLVLEERRFGKLSRVEAARVDHRLETLVKREAAFATKSRFGKLSRRSDE